MGGSPSWKVTTLPSLVVIGIVVVEIYFLVVEVQDTTSFLNYTTTIFSKAHDMPSSHMQFNFTIKIELMKAFAKVCNENSPILVTLNLKINLNIQFVTF